MTKNFVLSIYKLIVFKGGKILFYSRKSSRAYRQCEELNDTLIEQTDKVQGNSVLTKINGSNSDLKLGHTSRHRPGADGLTD